MAVHSIGLDPATLGHWTDGNPRIRLGSWFYSTGGVNDGSWQCVGGRLYIPAAAVSLGTVRMLVWHRTANNPPTSGSFDFDAATATRTAELEVPASPGWLDFTWATPFTFADAPASWIMIGYEFIDFPGHYNYDATKDPAPIGSATQTGLYLTDYSQAESRSYFTQNGNESTPASLPATETRNVWYGTDILVETGGAPPAVPEGTTALDHTWNVAVTGETPAVTVPEGTVALDHTWAVAVTGETPPAVVTVPEGTVSLVDTWSISVVGISPKPPTQTDNPINTLLDDLSVCLCAQILNDGLPNVCFCGVVPGDQIALDYAGNCADECGMAWVRNAGAYPSTVVGQPSTLPGNCSSGIGLSVELGIMRCMSVGEADGSGPSSSELEAASRLQQSDMLAMWRAVACCRSSKDWVIVGYTPYGPEGGLVGGTLTISALVI
jgi:hypothetical protein